jgi:hypothetical protein
MPSLKMLCPTVYTYYPNSKKEDIRKQVFPDLFINVILIIDMNINNNKKPENLKIQNSVSWNCFQLDSLRKKCMTLSSLAYEKNSFI